MASLITRTLKVQPLRLAVRSMSGGQAGDGSGKGGGAGGSIREAGGSFGKMEAAQEEQLFRKQQAAQLKALKSDLDTLDAEVKHHEKSIKHMEHEHLEVQRKQLRHELREYKVREYRNLGDYAELEDENISLQKQVSVLKQNQVEFESTKHESKRLQGDLEDYHMQLDELESLKGIMERKLEEALGSLAQEKIKIKIKEKEVGKIERLLEASESEKQELQNALDEAKKLIENTQKKVTMSEIKAVINQSDMSFDMQQDAVDCATRALEKYNDNSDIALFIKTEFDKKYNPTWQVIVIKHIGLFGYCVSPETKHFIIFHLDQVAIVLFKSHERLINQ